MCQEISAGVGNKEKKHEMEGNTAYEEGSFAGEVLSRNWRVIRQGVHFLS